MVFLVRCVGFSFFLRYFVLVFWDDAAIWGSRQTTRSSLHRSLRAHGSTLVAPIPLSYNMGSLCSIILPAGEGFISPPSFMCNARVGLVPIRACLVLWVLSAYIDFLAVCVLQLPSPPSSFL